MPKKGSPAQNLNELPRRKQRGIDTGYNQFKRRKRRGIKPELRNNISRRGLNV